MIPSKRTATQIKGRYKDQEVTENTAQKISPYFRSPSRNIGVSSGKDRGNAYHSFMHYADYEKCLDFGGIDGEIERLRFKGLLTQEQSSLIDAAMLQAFFTSPLGQKVARSESLIREFKFSILDDAGKYYDDVADEEILLQGVVDLAMVDQDGITVVDFKTDQVNEKSIGAMAEHYRTQVKLYADALSRIYQLPVKNTYLYFFNTNSWVEIN